MVGWRDRWIGGWVSECRDGGIGLATDGWMDGWVGGWMGGLMDGWVGGWVLG